MTHTPTPATPLAVGRNGSQRISITLPHAIYHHLVTRCDYEGRSLSNLCAFLLEHGCHS
jgi:hypothetical protein